jgi:hypothetical protein
VAPSRGRATPESSFGGNAVRMPFGREHIIRASVARRLGVHEDHAACRGSDHLAAKTRAADALKVCRRRSTGCTGCRRRYSGRLFRDGARVGAVWQPVLRPGGDWIQSRAERIRSRSHRYQLRESCSPAKAVGTIGRHSVPLQAYGGHRHLARSLRDVTGEARVAASGPTALADAHAHPDQRQLRRLMDLAPRWECQVELVRRPVVEHDAIGRRVHR